MSNTVKKPLVITNDDEIALVLRHRNKGVKAIALAQKAIDECPTIMSVLKFMGVKSTDIDRINTSESVVAWDATENKLQIHPWPAKANNLLTVKLSHYYFNQDCSLSKIKNTKLPCKCKGTLTCINGRAFSIELRGYCGVYQTFPEYFLQDLVLQKDSFRTDILDSLKQNIKERLKGVYELTKREQARYLKAKDAFDQMVSNLGKDYDKFFKPELETDINSGDYK